MVSRCAAPRGRLGATQREAPCERDLREREFRERDPAKETVQMKTKEFRLDNASE